MLTIISGTNRSEAVTAKLAGAVKAKLDEIGEVNELLDLAELPQEIFDPASYGEKPESFTPWQQSILDSTGILMVVPEYNGSFPGVLKYFVDMLKFPESLDGKPVGFIGLAAGHFGAVRAVEQMTTVVQYRNANVYGRRLFIHGSYQLNIDGKDLGIEEFQGRFETLLEGFAEFCKRN